MSRDEHIRPVLTEEEKGMIDEELSHYPTKRAGGVEALKIVQRRRGWISDELLLAIAQHVGMAPAELDRSATFYNLIFRRPVGRHVVLVCDSVSCWIMGADRLRNRLRHRLGIEAGETTPDGRFTMLPNVCLGACDRAPAVMIDETLHGPLTEDELDRLLDSHVP
ncbi:MAG: NADH:ubiquinone oxidoreductase, chain E [Candidatus Nitrospira kreftii]|uniref:NADH:ubiquinone oxidoreductase, chain E n=1 Tax=Candidatus Nitrospira kreftii TaxID=2652173 RepID=A0A7S8FET6_9BACT|nr:MAG: NADH:ubiquinone oxidoreductase, chain E [Candidatus Nitrospira kreftii]